MTEREPVIDVFEVSTSWTALIIKDESGDLYTNQAGGTACKHPVARGRVMDLELHDDINRRLAEYCYFVHGGWMTCIEDRDADVIDRILEPSGLKIDRRSVVTEYRHGRDDSDVSMEAWLHVKTGLGDAILVWPNSD